MTAPTDPSSTSQPADTAAPRPAPKPENLWLNLLCNIALPTLVLSKLSTEDRLGPVGALLAGLAIPLAYGIYDLARRRRWNVFSIVGVASVSLSGGLGLLEVGGLGFAVKEAAVPACFAVAILATLRARRPLVRELVMNESVVDVPRVTAALEERQAQAPFARLLGSSAWLLAASFGLSSVLNFLLARLILTAPPETVAFTQQLGRMTWVSNTVLIVPNLAIMVVVIWRFFSGLQKLTGLDLDTLMRAKPAPPKDPSHA